jgi:hypothetical protein
MQPHELAIHRVDERERLAVVKVGEPLVPDDRVEFCLGSVLDLGVQDHHVDEAAQRRERLCRGGEYAARAKEEATYGLQSGCEEEEMSK